MRKLRGEAAPFRPFRRPETEEIRMKKLIAAALLLLLLQVCVPVRPQIRERRAIT